MTTQRILYNFVLQQVPTYDNPKKEFLTTSSYNKFQLMTTQRKNSWQLLLTTSSNLWQPKERILDNFFLQQVPTYDNPKKEFLTTFSYNKFQLMTTQKKEFFTTSSSYNKFQLMMTTQRKNSLQLLQVTTYVKPWNFVGFVCGVWESCSYEVWEIPSYPKNPEENLLWTASLSSPFALLFLLCSYTRQCMKAVMCYPWRAH